MAQGDTLGVVMQSDIGSGASGGVAAQAQISGVFSASASYAVGAYVVYSGLLYRCTTAHSGAWDASHFEQVTIGGELNTRTPVYGRGENLIVNGYFVGGGSQQGGGQFPINQRGQTSYSATSPAAYCIDRWKVSYSTAVVTSTGIQLSNSGGFGLLQVLDPAVWDVLVGKTVTLSFLVSVLSDAATLYASDAEVAQTTQAGLITATFQVPAGIADARKFIAIRGNCTLIAGKLELGETQTLARNVGTDAAPQWVLNDPPPNYQQELAKCQRYFQVFRDQNLRPAYGMDYRPPMAKEQPTQSSFVLDGVTYYTASAEL